METKTRYIVIAVIIVIILCLGVIMFFVLYEDEKESPSDTPFDDDLYFRDAIVLGPPYYFAGVHEMQLNISEKGFGILTIGPFIIGEVPISGNVTFHNYTVITDINGTAVFNVTYPIESGEYDVIFEYKGEPLILRIDLKVIKD